MRVLSTLQAIMHYIYIYKGDIYSWRKEKEEENHKSEKEKRKTLKMKNANQYYITVQGLHGFVLHLQVLKRHTHTY